MNVTPVNNTKQNQPNFKAKLTIQYINNKGEAIIKKLSNEDVISLKQQAKKIGTTADSIKIKLHSKTVESNGPEYSEMGHSTCDLYEEQNIQGLTYIGGNLDVVDLSRCNCISYDGRNLKENSPFKVISKFLNQLTTKYNAK